LILLASLALSVTIFSKSWYLCMLIAVLGTLALFFSVFEKRSASAERVVLIAVLSALSAAGRVLFASIPSVQPSSFIIIMTGAVFGGETGFMTGAVTALASNLVLGQGPWTPWQMFCWGMMGLLSGLLARPVKNSMAFRLSYGFIWGFVFGWIMNVWFIFAGYIGDINWTAVAAAYIASFFFDLAHAGANTVLLLFFGNLFVRKLERIAVKYGLR
jgi:energy-coupling factor transport system substrate-specific component